MKNLKLLSNVLKISLVLIILFSPAVKLTVQTVAAQNTTTVTNPTYTLLEPLPEIGNTSQSSLMTEVPLNTYIIYAVNLLIAVAAAAAVFMIVWGGLQLMTTDSWEGKSNGKKKITDAIIGLLMVLSTYIILKTVNPALVNIPATLVPPITGLATSTVSGAGSFFDQLTQDAQNYNAQTAQLGTQLNQARSEVTGLQTQLANLQNQYNQTTDSTAKNQLGAQITDIQNQILGAQADATVKVAQSEMMTQMNGGNSNSNTGVDSNTQTKKLADVQSSENLVKTAYNNGLENLMSYGGDSPDNVQQLDDTYYYTYGNLYMQDRVLQQASMSSIPQIEAMIKNDFLKNIKDSNLKTQLQQSYVSTLTLLCPFAQNKPTACNPISAQ